MATVREQLVGFMSVAAAGEYLGVSRARLNELVRAGELLPVITLGPRTRLVPRAAVEALAKKWLAEANAR
jgi:excisionase family DNA binding protein